jgi:phytoene dehydrogenase-like protein
VDARLSRYSYLVSLLPQRIIDDLGLSIQLRRRRYSSYTPVPAHPDGAGLLIDNDDLAATRAGFDRLGALADHDAWCRFYDSVATVARRVWPTMLEPLRSRADLRALVADDQAWHDLIEQPIGAVVRRHFADDTVAGVVLTDALIGTFADVDSAELAANRCFLYHVIGGGSGHWDVPVGGMGTVSGELERAARDFGATLVTSARVTAVDPGSSGCAAEVAFVDADAHEHRVGAGHVLAGCAPSTLSGLLAQPVDKVEGAQLKVNMVLSRLPRLRDDVDPVAAFSGTFHINEQAGQLAAAYRQAAAGRVPDPLPCEIYCHSLTDPTILGPQLRQAGAVTLTMFALHLPAALFAADNDGVRDQALRAALASLNSVLAEPIEPLLWRDTTGQPCLEARSPLDVQADVGLPGGNIFQRPLQWPFAESDDEVGRWGVETAHPRLLLAGAGARRGGGVSGIPGRNAAMAVLGC